MKQTMDNERNPVAIPKRDAVAVPGRDAVAVPGRDAVATLGQDAVAIPADGVRDRVVTARRSDDPANCRKNRGKRWFRFRVDYVMRFRHND